ncbi:hypothetical protein BDV30DRAFT_245054 [Aspergillus minisclerotigenes]|uniref:Helicase C-terminal domain-containing protein n=1 Tax=Aspergillus minisclerotigenes TaxID=656917 RepID=A0A5N6INE6_9EURO|nr:hypothetical protein BDV30DRAFT_245054 [Aspergillus minisclerotigenes]
MESILPFVPTDAEQQHPLTREYLSSAGNLATANLQSHRSNQGQSGSNWCIKEVNTVRAIPITDVDPKRIVPEKHFPKGDDQKLTRTQSYPWGHPAYAFLLEVMKQSGKWADLKTEQGRALLKLIEVCYFELPTADSRGPLQGNRIVHWPLPADLFNGSKYAWGKLDPWPSDSSDLPRFTFPAVPLEVRYAFAVALSKSWMVNKPKSLNSSCAVADFEKQGAVYYMISQHHADVFLTVVEFDDRYIAYLQEEREDIPIEGLTGCIRAIGLNLHRSCALEVQMEGARNLNTELQSAGRLGRMGQTKPQKIFLLHQDYTVSAYLRWLNLEKAQALISAAMKPELEVILEQMEDEIQRAETEGTG